MPATPPEKRHFKALQQQIACLHHMDKQMGGTRGFKKGNKKLKKRGR